jgi:sec-independent protein translocase protein TatA
MPGWIGPWEIAILLVVVLLVFGPKRLPEMGKSLGRGMREFKHSISGKDESRDEPAELTAVATEAVATEEDLATTPAAKRERDSI